MIAGISRALPAVLSVTYLLLAHGASVLHRPRLALLALLALAVALLMGPLQNGRKFSWLVLAAVVAGLWWLDAHELAMLPLYAPPVLLTVFFAWLFGHTLLPGAVPLVERFARLLEPGNEPLPAEVVRYARRVTGAWTLLLASIALVNLLLALFATPHGLLRAWGFETPVEVPHSVWSWFANVINYGAIGAFFIAEYLWRRHRFAHRAQLSFVEFCRRMAAIPVAGWRALGR